EVLDFVRPGRGRRASMAAMVEADQPEVLRQRKLTVPHPQARPERASHQQHRRVVATDDLMVGLDHRRSASTWIPANRPSDRKEDRLALALQTDGEPVSALYGFGQQRSAALRRNGG